jgi:hypothetical protein
MPGLRGALTVRVSDGQTDRLVTPYCRGLKFTKVAPGGHQSLSFGMVLPRYTFTDLGPQDRAYVYDARTARTIIEGYLENPTPTDGPDGQQYDISAVGGMALANDEARGLIYVDHNLDTWPQDTGSAAAATTENGLDPIFPPNQHVSTVLPGGSVVATGALSQILNTACQRAGMNLGGVQVGARYSGKVDAGYAEEFVTASGILQSRSMTTTPALAAAWVTDTNFPAGTQAIGLRLRRTGAATNVADDTTWTRWVDVSIIGQRMDRNGTLLVGSGGLVSLTQVLASQVVEDLLGRLLTFCDPGTAQIDATTFGITQLAYPDGVKAAGVLNDLVDLWEPGFLWEVLESLDSGKHRFSYRAWPTTPRYEVSTTDGWRQTGSDADLCNRILVSWTDPAGSTQVTIVTAASLGLTGIGLPVDDLGTRVKDADPISLPDGLGSVATATRIGGQILTDKINPPKAGTVVVRRPIIDMLTGNRVMPWEIEPGYLCRVRETGDDLRITQVDYDDDTVSMVLTLGTPVLTTDQRLARLDAA